MDYAVTGDANSGVTVTVEHKISADMQTIIFVVMGIVVSVLVRYLLEKAIK